MINQFNKIEALFEEIDSAAKNKIDVYVIGGAVLLHQGLKTATKDIDLVVGTKNDFIEFQETLKRQGFRANIPGQEYSRMNLNQIFTKGDYRVDVFENQVCGQFTLSEGMKRRARKVVALKHLSVFLCSNEDVFLFKTMTEREGDLDDCENIARAGVEWKTILEEIEAQVKISGQRVWITWIGERLDILEERGLEMPIMNRINKLRDDFFNNLERKTNN